MYDTMAAPNSLLGLAAELAGVAMACVSLKQNTLQRWKRRREMEMDEARGWSAVCSILDFR